MMKFEFIATDEKTRKVHHTVVAEALPQVLDGMKDFLLGCGFNIDCKDTLDVVPFSEAQHHDVVVDWSDN